MSDVAYPHEILHLVSEGSESGVNSFHRCDHLGERDVVLSDGVGSEQVPELLISVGDPPECGLPRLPDGGARVVREYIIVQSFSREVVS